MEDAGYTDTSGVAEVCPHCDCEIFFVGWDVEKHGFVAVCSNCKEEIMICSECMREDDNPCQKCDWQKTSTGGRCFRGETVWREFKQTQ